MVVERGDEGTVDGDPRARDVDRHAFARRPPASSRARCSRSPRGSCDEPPAWAVVPAKSLARGKSRLSPVLDEDARARFARRAARARARRPAARASSTGCSSRPTATTSRRSRCARGACVLRDDGAGSLRGVVDRALAEVASRGAACGRRPDGRSPAHRAAGRRRAPRRARPTRRRPRARPPRPPHERARARPADRDAHALRPRRQLRGSPEAARARRAPRSPSWRTSASPSTSTCPPTTARITTSRPGAGT